MMNSTTTSIEKQAKASWLCPLMAWGSQFLLAIIWRGIPGLGLMWAFAALVQFLLICAGVVLGVKVLSQGGSALSSASRKSAIAGIILSGGTFLLIAGLFARDALNL